MCVIFFIVTELDRIKEKTLKIEERIGYQFKNKELIVLAFTHSSYSNENEGAKPNERLEFLGDSILSLIVSEELYRLHPEAQEGVLSRLRANIVDAEACASMVEELSLGRYLLLGKGERANLERGKKSLYADLFEALIGAIYLDGDFPAAKAFFFAHFANRMSLPPARNFKAELQDYAQRMLGVIPEYRLILESGPDHAKVFEIEVLVNNDVLGRGLGSSKKEAEISAAKDAMKDVDM